MYKRVYPKRHVGMGMMQSVSMHGERIQKEKQTN